DFHVTGVQTCALPILAPLSDVRRGGDEPELRLRRRQRPAPPRPRREPLKRKGPCGHTSNHRGRGKNTAGLARASESEITASTAWPVSQLETCASLGTVQSWRSRTIGLPRRLE